jgi:dipeptidyl aminopeptidase/acylaminoacyl peptidase
VGRTKAPYGSWESSIPIEVLGAGRVSLSDTRFDPSDGSAVWLEGRPDEDGRQVLVRSTPEGEARDISPPGMNVRDRVHEYGGAPFLVARDLVVVSDFATGRLHRVARDRSSKPITPDGAFRYADLQLDRDRRRLVAIREDHTGTGEAVASIVAIPLDGSGEVSILISGRTFYSSPRLSPAGDRLAFLAWDHPNMPWDGTELFVAPIDATGGVGEAERVAGSSSDWIAQPRWSPRGVLHFVAEPTGWMNIHRLVDGATQPVTALEAEFAFPDWWFGFASYAFTADGDILAAGRDHGVDRLYRISADGIATLDLSFTELGWIDVRGDEALMLAAGPRSSEAVVVLDLAAGTHRVLRRSVVEDPDPATISIPEPIEFETTGGLTAHGLFYRPVNPDFEGPPGELPPLILTSHGGPTAQAFGGVNVALQLFTSRGLAVLDVDYGGSTGYGRDYRKRLEGEWGVVDVDDCVSGARALAERGDVDAARIAIRGGSSSGFTTLAAITFRDVFAAGISYFGIGDLLNFAKETHKFESRYLDRLLGPLPEAAEIWRARSPVHFAERIHCPVLILQGLDDHVVPAAEAERIVDALWERRVPHAYLAFPGEDHGFRKASTIVRSFEAELSFLGQVFGFEPADQFEPLEVINLEASKVAAAAR